MGMPLCRISTTASTADFTSENEDTPDAVCSCDYNENKHVIRLQVNSKLYQKTIISIKITTCKYSLTSLPILVSHTASGSPS